MEVGFRRRLGLEPGQMLGLVVPQQEWQIGAQTDDGAKKRTGGQLRLRSSLHVDGRATLHYKNLISRSHESESSVCTVSSEKGKTCSPLTNLYLTIMCISTVAYKYLRLKDYICLLLSMNMWLEYKPSVSL